MPLSMAIVAKAVSISGTVIPFVDN